MQINKLDIRYFKIEELKPYEKNARKNNKAVDAVAESIKEFGFKNPIIVDENMEIIAGHTRYKASQKLQLEEVPVIVVKDLTEEQVKAFRLADNKLSELADWDFELLAEELNDLKLEDFDIFKTGFSEKEVDKLFEDFGFSEEKEESFNLDEALEDIKEPKAKKGDVFLLGKHRLMCGDSTSSEDVEKLMNGALADMVFTDPPYNVAYEGKTAEALTIQNDKMSKADFGSFLDKVFKNYFNIMRAGASIYVCHSDFEGEAFRRSYREAGLKFSQSIIWVKDVFVMGRHDYHSKHEPIIYGWKEGASHYFIDDRKQDTVWEIARPKRNTIHPTMKPLELVERAIKNSTKAGKEQIVVDLFGGSGSTLIGAELTGRVGYSMELDEKYADVIVNRYIETVGSADGVFVLRDDKKIPYEDFKKLND